MERHFELNDFQFIGQFENATLDPSIFSHEAHLRLAWIYIRRYGVQDALTRICEGLQQYVRKIGAEDKFNITLTIAATRAVDHFMQKAAAADFHEFIVEFPQLKYRFRELLASHYSTDIFSRVEVKKSYLEPDLLPFD